MSKKYIILGLVSFLMIGLALNTLSVKADAPIEIDLYYEYDRDAGGPQNQTLSAWFIHGVTDRNAHYIASVAIDINGSLVLTEYYTSQPTHNLVHYEYWVTAEHHDIITVTATCNRGGSMAISLTVGHPHIIVAGTFLLAVVPLLGGIYIVFALVYFLPYLGKKPSNKKEIRIGLLGLVVGIVIIIAASYLVELLFVPEYIIHWNI